MRLVAIIFVAFFAFMCGGCNEERDKAEQEQCKSKGGVWLHNPNGMNECRFAYSTPAPCQQAEKSESK